MALNGNRLVLSSWSNYFGLYFTWSANQNIGGNYSDITVNTYAWLGRYGYLDIGSRGDNYSNVGGNAINVYAPGVTKYSSTETTVLLNSRTQRVYHNADGTLPNVFIRFVWYIRAYIDGVYRDNVDCSFYTGAINTIPRASKITSDVSLTIPNNLQIKIQSFYNAFTHDITLKVGGNTLRTLTGVKGNQTITFTDEEIQNFYNETTKKYLDSQITVVTKNGNTTIGTTTKTGKFYFNESENKPIFEQFTFEPLDTGTKDLTGWTDPIETDNGLSIKNKTQYKITCGDVTLKNNATLNYYLVELNGKSYKATTSTIELDTPITYADYLKVSVVDSRGFTTTVSKQLTVLDYSDPIPQGGMNIERQVYPDNGDVKITGQVKFTKTDSISNVATIYARYKLVNSETWSDMSPISFDQTGDTLTIDYTMSGFELDELYNFELIINDYYKKDIVVEALILKDVPDIYLKPHDIEIDGNSVKSSDLNIITLNKTDNQANTGAGTTYTVAFNSAKTVKIGNKLNQVGNTVVIGAGVKKVEINATLWINLTVGSAWGWIYSNKQGRVAQTYCPMISNANIERSFNLTKKIIEVEEGEILSMQVHFSGTSATNGIKGNYANACYMTVEVME